MSELFPSYNAVEARREWEVEMIKEKLDRNESVDTPVCRVEKDSTNGVLRFGLKRGKLLYLFKYPDHDVERDKHRNVITRARFIKNALEKAGYRLIPWDFKKAQTPTFWEESRTMEHEEEDDDLYGPSETRAPVAKQEHGDDGTDGEGDQPMDEGLESGEEEEEDSDSDLEIIIDKAPAPAKPASQPPPKQESKAIKIEAPPQTSTSTTTGKPITHATSAPQQPAFGTGPPGTDYPAVHSSTIDLEADPVYPPVGKPILHVDMDADIAENQKNWRLPGQDQSDYFNYGFDEFTWETYRQRQINMANQVQGIKMETQSMMSMMNMMGGQGGPAGGVPGAPTGPAAAQGGGMPGGMPGMPDMGAEQMQAMFNQMQQMQAQGMDVANMDHSQYMQAGGSLPGFGGFGGGGQQQGGYGGGQGGGRGSGRRGRGGW